MAPFIHIRSAKFPVVPGEDDEVVNDGMYGKAVALYLQERLGARGIRVPAFAAEDWGWLVEVEMPRTTVGIGIYAGPADAGAPEYACTALSIGGGRQWSWKKFGFVDDGEMEERLTTLHAAMLAVFQEDAGVEVVAVGEEMPF